MQIDEIVEEIERRKQTIAILAVRVLKREPPRLRGVIIHKTGRKPATVSDLDNRKAKLTNDDKGARWHAVGRHLFKTHDAKVALMATLLQIVAEDGGATLSDDAALTTARRKLTRNEPGPLFENQIEHATGRVRTKALGRAKFKRC